MPHGVYERDGILITVGEMQSLSCVWKDIDFPFGWCVWFNQLQVCVKSSARSRYTQKFKRLLRNTRLQGGVYRGKPIKLKDDEVNGVRKKCGIDNVPSFVTPLTPGLCIHKSAETFLNCFKREGSSEQRGCFHFSFLSALGYDIVFREKLGEDPPGHIIVWAAIKFWITPMGAAKPSGIELLCLPIELDVLQLW